MPKLARPLTARAVANLKCGQELADGALPGLRVRQLSCFGRLCWSLRFGQGVRRRLGVGHDLSLAEAREKAGELRRALERGEDPAAANKAAKARAVAARQGVGTLGAIVEHYYSGGPGAALRTGAQQRKTIARVFQPLLGHVASDLRRTELQLAADATGRPRGIGCRRGAAADPEMGGQAWLVREETRTGLERPELHQRSEENGQGQVDRRYLPSMS